MYRSGDRIRSPALKWLPESIVSAASTRLQEYLVKGSPSTRKQREAFGFVVQLENTGVYLYPTAHITRIRGADSCLQGE